MNVIEIPFSGIRPPKETIELSQKPGLGWSAGIKPPTRFYLFGGFNSEFALSEYGAIRYVPSRPDKTAYKDGRLPASLNEVIGGYVVIPWGEPQRLLTCGTAVQMFTAGDRVVIDYKTKSTTRKIGYMYQVHFFPRNPGVLEIHYYNCLSGGNTIVGVVAEPGNITSWRIKPDQIYHKVALRFNTNPNIQEEPGVIVIEESQNIQIKPLGIISNWDTKFKSDSVWLQLRD